MREYKNIKNKSMVSVLLVAVIFVTCVFLSSCSNVPQNNNDMNNYKTPATGQTQYPVTITDQLGRQVEIKKSPSRIICNNFPTTSALIALEQTQKIVGIEFKVDSRNIYKQAAPQLCTLPVIGTDKQISVPECMKLSPDLIIASVSSYESASKFDEENVPVIYVDLGSEELLNQSINMLAVALDANARCSQLQSARSLALSDVKNIARVISFGQPKVYYASSKDVFTTSPKEMFPSSVIRNAGCINCGDAISGSSLEKVEAENILEWNPD